MARLRRLVPLLAAAVLSAAPQSPSFSRRVWQMADGLPEDFAQAITQTPDGYLWIGSSGGLVRFDGIRFTVYSAQSTPAFRDDSVYCLLTARDGTVWAGTEGGGLVRLRRGAFRVYGPQEGLTNGFVRSVYEDRSGRLWAGTDNGLFRLENDRLIRVDARDGVPRIAVNSIWEDRRGRLLVGGSGLLILDGASSTYYRSSENLADSSIRAIRQTADGAVWIGTISGLRRLPDGIRGDPFLAPKLIDGTNVACLAESGAGELWIGTYGQGLIRYRDGRMERFTAPLQLPHNNVLWVFEDAEADVWVGTQGGLLRLSPSAARTLTTADGVPQSINTVYQDPAGALFATALNGRLFEVAREGLLPARLPASLDGVPIRNVLRDSSGALWIGTDGQGAIRIAGRETRHFTMKQGLVNDFVRAFCEDRDGAIWIGADGGLSRWRDGEFVNFNVEDGLAYGSIRAVILDGAGGVWVATDGGLSRFADGRFVADPLLDGIRGVKIWSLYRDTDGGLWIGAHGSGLFLLKDGKLSRFTTAEGLPTNKIHFIAETPDGNLWMSGPGGVFSVARAALERAAAGAAGPPAVRVYGAADGLTTTQMNGGVQSAGAVGRDGELWFPSTRGLVGIRPDAPVSRAAPAAWIEEVLADDRQQPLDREVRVAAGAGKLEVRYTAIRLRAPEGVRFKYWLEGFDPAWTDAGQRRVAYYTNVPPGAYRFHVVAYELSDPLRAAERILEIRWLPHFYETAWFLGLAAIAVGGAAFGAYRLHVRNLRRRFEAVLDERSRLAREMHDTLIQGCVGVSTLLEAASAARRVSPEVSDDLLDRARQEVRSTVDEARLAVWNLRHETAAVQDIGAEIAQMARRISSESGTAVPVEVCGAPVPLAEEAGRSLLMALREALQNALRHAGATRISVKVVYTRQTVTIEVSDNGCGFDATAAGAVEGHHYGLTGMRERVAKLGGSLDLDTAPGRGARIRLRIPLRSALLARRVH